MCPVSIPLIIMLLDWGKQAARKFLIVAATFVAATTELLLGHAHQLVLKSCMREYQHRAAMEVNRSQLTPT